MYVKFCSFLKHLLVSRQFQDIHIKRCLVQFIAEISSLQIAVAISQVVMLLNSCYVFRHYIFNLFMKTCEIPSSTIFASFAKTARMPGLLLTLCFQLCVNVTHFSQCRQAFPRFGIQELVSKYRELSGGFKPVRSGEIFVLKERQLLLSIIYCYMYL